MHRRRHDSRHHKEEEHHALLPGLHRGGALPKGNYYCLHSRKDQLASCFLHNISEVLYCMNATPPLEPVYTSQHTFLNVARGPNEGVSPLYIPFIQAYGFVPWETVQKHRNARAPNLSIKREWNKIDESGIAAVISTRSDVVTSYASEMPSNFRNAENMGFQYDPAYGDVCCIHARYGDVANDIYQPTTFDKCSKRITGIINAYKDLEDFKGDYSKVRDTLRQCRDENGYGWGQCSMTIKDIGAIVDEAKRNNPDCRTIQIITHQPNSALVDMCKEKSTPSCNVEVRAGEDVEISIARMIWSKDLYIANSYIGFLAGLLRSAYAKNTDAEDKRKKRVHYPPNAMFAIFGLGSKYDQSGWTPMGDILGVQRSTDTTPHISTYAPQAPRQHSATQHHDHDPHATSHNHRHHHAPRQLPVRPRRTSRNHRRSPSHNTSHRTPQA